MARWLLVSLTLVLTGPVWSWAQETPAEPSPPAAPVKPDATTAPANWQYPLDVAVGSDGSYFIVDRNLPGIWQWKDGVNKVLFQGSKKFRTPMNAPRCVHVAADGTIYAGDSATREIYSISPQGEAKPLTHGSIGIPTAIAVVDGIVYSTDLELQRIWKFPATGIPITKQPDEFAVVGGCRGLFVDDNGFIWALSSLKPQLRKYTGDGKFTPVVDDLVFEFPHQVTVTKEGTAYVTDGYAKAIWKIPPGGKPEKWVSGEPLVNPVGIRQQGADILVCDSRANALFKITPDAKIEKIHGGTPLALPAVAAPAEAATTPAPAATDKPAEATPAKPQ